MAKAYLWLDKRHKLKDGTYPIKMSIVHSTTIYISTGITVNQDLWDTESRTCIGKGNRLANQVLFSILTRINTKILKLQAMGLLQKISKKDLKTILSNPTDDISFPQPKENLGTMFEKVIATKNRRNAELFRQTLKKLTEYKDPYGISFDLITKLWLTGFYASMKNLSVNTKAIHMRNLRNVINFAIDEGITQHYAFHKFHIPTQETETRALPINRLRYLRDCPHLGKYDTEHRDMFMLMFYLIGINVVDLARLTSDNYINGRISYRRAKTGKLYSIKVEPEAAAIIEKYKGNEHLLSCFDRYQDYKNYAQHLNDSLRKIGPIKSSKSHVLRTANHYLIMDPIEPRITSYWARYSWATIAAELDIPKDTISECLGHEYGSKITGLYIKFNRNKIDEANRKVLDYLNDTGKDVS